MYTHEEVASHRQIVNFAHDSVGRSLPVINGGKKGARFGRERKQQQKYYKFSRGIVKRSETKA